MSRTLCLFVGAALSACVTDTHEANSPTGRYAPELPYDAVIVYDRFSPAIEVKMTPGKRGQAPDGTEIISLNGQIDRKTGSTLTWVSWTEVYTDRQWRFYSRASSDKGKALSMKEVDRSVHRCSSGTCVYSETYSVMVPLPDLEAAMAGGGIKFKLYGKLGDERLVHLPAFSLKPFVGKVEEARQYQRSVKS